IFAVNLHKWLKFFRTANKAGFWRGAVFIEIIVSQDNLVHSFSEATKLVIPKIKSYVRLAALQRK
ncbi:MAG: hypothetical protein VX879_10815, partial [Pseudomonadota bacterium]|nr:hypothetical protein [Pseudomonadota bacterium]